MLVGVVVLVRSDWFVPRFDLAAQELGLQEAAHAQRLLGPYSHFGFDHPGPMLYYAAVPWYFVLAKSGGLAIVLTRLCVDATCIALMIVLVDRIGGRIAAWGATIGLLWFELRVGLEWFRDPWNPYAIVLPTALALVAAAALFEGSRGRRWRAIVLVVAGSYAVQSHVGTGLLVALALVVGLAGFVRSARRSDSGPVLVDSLIVVGVAILCWALPLWQQLTTSHGNLTALWTFFSGPTSGQPSLDTVIGPATAAVTLPAGHFGWRLNSGPLSLLPSIGALWWCVLMLLVGSAVGYAVWSWRSGRVGMAALAACVPASYAVAIIAGLQIRGGVSPYLFAPTLAVGAIAWLTVGAAAADIACRLAARGRGRVLLAWLAVVLLVITIAVGFGAFSTLGERFGSSFAQQLDPGVPKICRLGRPVHLVSTTAQWYQVLEVAAALGECAPDVRLDPGVRYIVGARRTNARQPADVSTVRLESPAVPLASGWTRVAHNDSASLDMQASLRGRAP